MPWQVTGNHWLTLPCIHPADGSLHAVGILHRGARSTVEFSGGPHFLDGGEPPLARPTLQIDGKAHEISEQRIVWERALGWLPTFTCPVGELVVRGTIFAPHGRDADVPGAVYALVIENRGARSIPVTVSLDGMLGHRQQRVRTPRPFDDAHRIARSDDGQLVLLEGASRPGHVALAIGSDGPAEVEVREEERPTFAIRRRLTLEAGGRAEVAFFLAVGPERDGARATAQVMQRRGWRTLLGATRDVLHALEQSTGHESIDLLINRNLLFAYFCAVGRALDDAHYYIVRTRLPWHGAGVTVRDWEALTWVIPAILLADAPLARELLLRCCELHGYAPGRGVHYFDGTLFEPGFAIEGVAGYALAVDRYIRESGDDQIVEEPVLADTLYLSADELAERRDRGLPLYSTEVGLSGRPPRYRYTLHGNAVVAQALDILRRTLDEETAREVEDPEAVRAAIRRHFAVEHEGKGGLASAVDLGGAMATEDDPLASALWLPLYDAIERHDSLYRRTVKRIDHSPRHLAQQCARLLGPESADVLEWIRRAPLDNGFAATEVDEQGRAVADGGDASLAGLLAWCCWYAVHALGVRPEP